MTSLKKPSSRQLNWLKRISKRESDDAAFMLYRVLDEFEDEQLLPEWLDVWNSCSPTLKATVPQSVYAALVNRFSEIELIDEKVFDLSFGERDNICFILGAGASAPDPSSIPTVNCLLPELWRRARRIGREEIDRLADWCDSHGVTNIEDLLTATYIANYSAKNSFVTGLLEYYLFTRDSSKENEISPYGRSGPKRPQVDSSSIALLQDTLQILFGLLTGTMLPAEPNGGHDAIVSFSKGHPKSSIVTTNYDGCIDEALIRSDVLLNTNVDESASKGEGIDLIKIHGSINWSYCDSCHEVKEFDLINLKKVYELDTISYPVIGICKRCQGQRRTLLIPPMGLKFIMFPNLIRLWDLARVRIEKAKIIIVVGYSFSEADTYINKIIERSMTNNQKQKMVICDTDSMLATILRERYSARIDGFDESRILRVLGSSSETLPEILSSVPKKLKIKKTPTKKK